MDHTVPHVVIAGGTPVCVLVLLEEDGIFLVPDANMRRIVMVFGDLLDRFQIASSVRYGDQLACPVGPHRLDRRHLHRRG